MGERAVAARCASSLLTGVNVRIGWVQPGETRPETIDLRGAGQRIGRTLPDQEEIARGMVWFRGMWLSNRDFLQLMEKALTAPAGLDMNPYEEADGRSLAAIDVVVTEGGLGEADGCACIVPRDERGIAGAFENADSLIAMFLRRRIRPQRQAQPDPVLQHPVRAGFDQQARPLGSRTGNTAPALACYDAGRSSMV